MKIKKWLKREISERWPHLLLILVYLAVILVIFVDERIHVFCVKPITEIKIGEAIFVSIIVLIFTRK